MIKPKKQFFHRPPSLGSCCEQEASKWKSSRGSPLGSHWSHSSPPWSSASLSPGWHSRPTSGSSDRGDLSTSPKDKTHTDTNTLLMCLSVFLIYWGFMLSQTHEIHFTLEVRWRHQTSDQQSQTTKTSSHTSEFSALSPTIKLKSCQMMS